MRDVSACLVFALQCALAIEVVPFVAKWLLLPAGVLLAVLKASTTVIVGTLKVLGCAALVTALIILVNLSAHPHPELILVFRLIAGWMLGLAFIGSVSVSKSRFEEIRDRNYAPMWLETYAAYVTEPPVYKAAFAVFIIGLFVPALNTPSLIAQSTALVDSLANIPFVSGFLFLFGIGCLFDIFIRSLIAVGVISGRAYFNLFRK